MIDQLRVFLRAPEVIVATWRAAQPNPDGLTEGEVREALGRLDPLWAHLFPAEQARIVQLLVDRIEIGSSCLKISFRDKGLARMVTELGAAVGNGQTAAA